MKQKNRRGAMEMSVGTIVTIVLLVAVLVLGLVLVRTIFTGAVDVTKLTNAQLQTEVNKLFTADQKMVILPQTDIIQMSRGKASGIGIGVRNLLQGNVGTNPTFDYNVTVSDPQIQKDCGISQETAQNWIQGGSGVNVPMPTGQDTQVEKTLFNIPSSAPLCNIKIQVEIIVNGANYATSSFFISIQ